MMRVLFVTNYFPPDYAGGAEISLYHSCRGLMADGVACRILHINNRRTATDDVQMDFDGIPVHRVQFATRWPWQEIVDRRIVDAVRREIRAFRPDMLHVHNVSGASLAPFVAGREMQIPTVATLHDHWLLCPNNILYREDGQTCDPGAHSDKCGHCFRRYDYWADVPERRAIFAHLTNQTRLFISPSQALIAQHIAAGYSPSRFRCVPYGIEDRPVPTGSLAPAVAEATAAAQTRPTVLFAGGGIEIKGAQTVLTALPLLASQVEDLLVVVAGGGDADVLQSFRQYEPTVQVVGRVPFLQMRALYNAADLILFPSVCLESYGLVIFEGFQSGTPAAGTALGGAPELIGDGQRGYLFPPHDPEALAASVAEHFSKTPLERRRMRHACREYASTQLSLSRHVARLRRTYDEALH